MVLVYSQLYGNCNGSIWFKGFASLAFKPDATIVVTIQLTINKYHLFLTNFDATLLVHLQETSVYSIAGTIPVV